MSATPTRRLILVTILLAAVAPHWSCASKGTTSTSRTNTRQQSITAPAPAPAKSPEPQARADAKPGPPAVRVLFIGDSYTFYNGGVDAVLEALAAAGGRPMECTAVTSGDKTLQWHWEEGEARSAIARGGWDYVVLQEYNTRPVAAPNLMRTFAEKFDAEIRNAGARTVLFVTWARFNEPEKQRTITRAYDAIAKDLGALVARVGPAWERSLEARPRVKLYAADRNHPSPAGTYLAACVLYATLTGDSPEGLPATITTMSGKTIDLDPDDAESFQRAAAVVSATPSRPAQPRRADD